MITCKTCNFENPDTAKECEMCGAELVRLCSCGFELKPHWKLCPECGKAVAKAQTAVGAGMGNGINKPFLMPIEDVFLISGRGTVVTGKIERGIVKLGDEVEIVGIKSTKRTKVTGVEMFNKLLSEAMAGDGVGILLDGINKKEVERGQFLAKPGSITLHDQTDKVAVYLGIGKEYLDECLRLIEAGELKGCKQKYAQMVETLGKVFGAGAAK